MSGIMKQGQCRICGLSGRLSFEHIPPKSVFNSWKQKIYSGQNLLEHIKSDNLPWDVSKAKGKVMQRGTGGYTLCTNCNSFTGRYYNPSFIEFSMQTVNQLVDINKDSKFIKIKFSEIHPLRIIKQIVSIFLSINRSTFSDKHKELRHFVLQKETTTEFKNLRIYAYINRGIILKNVGVAVKINNGVNRVISEITTIPFGFVLDLEPVSEDTLTNISFFAKDYALDQKIDMEISFPILESNTYLPLDYRSKNEIENSVNTNLNCEVTQ